MVILGGGESGVGTAILGQQKGYDVFVSDFGKIKNNYKEVLEFKKGVYKTPVYDYSDIYGISETGRIVGSEILSGVDPDIGEFGLMTSYQIKFDIKYPESLYDSILRKVIGVGVFRPYKSSSRATVDIDGVNYVYVFCEDKEYIYLDDEVMWE